jgi:hypothetical protein
MPHAASARGPRDGSRRAGAAAVDNPAPARRGFCNASIRIRIASLIAHLPRGYVGSFQWDGSAETQQVAVAFTTLAPLDDGKVEARGCGRYDVSGRVTEIRVKMQIDAATLAAELWELDPIGSVSFTTDGIVERSAAP